MDSCFMMVLFSSMSVSLTMMDRYATTFLRRLPCCNGTLGYAAIPMVPCSSFRCCDEKYQVAVTPVNHALGYIFRCESKTKFSKTKCYKNGDIVATTNETAKIYETKICCQGNKFDLQFNKDDIGLIVRCLETSSLD